ncbi:ATP-binding protein [Paenibacillus sp. 481]|uniref:ATP-binding protein n=1 Tax=Paenibacillus sp. 481 TaxID=2835869 RepID=UPI001E45E23B|nr:ATP-binding protein [Paenibacillus sp. 481]UHA73274.1 ATP-binding protein [Paenibacillus sp. 481]
MTTHDKNPTAGIGDPYWYEWTIGQKYVVDMLNTDNRIEYVILQATEAQGLDDVVIVYADGTSEYVQVKHTRAEDTITFGNMLSLLKSMSKAWATLKSKWMKCSPVLFSNRKISTKSTTMKDSNTVEYHRPALDQFLLHLQSELTTAFKLTDVRMPVQWLVAWNEWNDQLSGLSSDDEKLEFLKLLVIKAEQPDLEELTSQVTQKISTTFGISTEKARSIFSQLDHALRKWVTTSRGQKESIHREEVYEVLSMRSQELVGEHMLLPPAPFFPSRLKFLEDLSNHLLSGSHPITFLTGMPGQGKTSVVSALANRRDPIIDLRYHAFKPITPQTERLPADSGVTTKAEVLWGDLLIELRSFFFKGRLARYNVPIRNDFLTLVQLISEVLRLANILGEERGRPTIIAIDGIDHAARAGVDQHSFLETLIPPDAVPKHVHFLIVGQPANSYDKYPFWLKGSSYGVSRWIVEGIQEEDISQLLATEIPELPVDQFQATVRLINYVSKENTLAAIFAIEEAKSLLDVDELQIKLTNRRLTNSISEYYENIWLAAVARLDDRFPFVGQRLASCLSLANERVTGKDLAIIFAEVMNISPIDWTEALRALRPLVIEENDGFRVTHNDVRVHLTKQVHAQPERLREVASLIANYYWKVPDKGIARHASLFDLLRKSDRHSDQARVFMPEYVMEGIALERPIRELHEQCQQALLHVAETRDWDCVHAVSCAAATLVQLHKSVDWTGSSFEYVPDVPPLLFSEGRVPNKEAWTLDGVHLTMVDAYRLIQVHERERAYSLIRRWFFDMTPIDLVSILKDNVFDQITDYEHLNETFQATLRVWGQVSYHVGLLWTESKESYMTEDVLNRQAWAHFSNGVMSESLEYGDLRDWIWSRQVSVYTFFSDMEENLLQLASKRRWPEIAYTLKEWGGKRDRLPDTFQIKAAALSLFTERKDLFDFWVQPIVDEGFKCLENIDSSRHLEDHVLLYCMVSFVLGWTQPSRENSGIGEEGVAAYYVKRRDSRTKGHLSALLRGSALAGKWLGTYRRRGEEAAGRIVSSHEVKLVLKALVIKKRNFNETAYKDQPATKWIVEVIIECASLIGGEADRTVYQFMKEYSQSYPVNYMMEIAWRYLWDRGEEELLEHWFLHWCADEGRAWHHDVAERVDIVNRISDLAAEIGFQQEAKRARQLLKWGMIGYTGHKEYVLESPQDWYKELAKLEPEIWENEGKQLLEICQVASELGDNRLAIFVEAVVAGSVVYEGPTAMWRLLNAQNVRESFLENINMIFDGLISVLETIETSETDLLTIWSFGIGALNWHDGYERCYLQDLKKALCLAAQRNGINSISDKLEGLGPAEYNVQGNRDRYRIPNRWYEDTESGVLSSDEEKNEFYQTLKNLSVEEAIEQLTEPTKFDVNLEVLCSGIYVIANRLEAEKPTGYPKHLQRLIGLLLERNYGAITAFARRTKHLCLSYAITCGSNY